MSIFDLRVIPFIIQRHAFLILCLFFLIGNDMDANCNLKIIWIPHFNILTAKIKTMKDVNIYKSYMNHEDFLQERQCLVYTGKDYDDRFYCQAYVAPIFYERVDIMIFNNAFIQGWNILGTEGYLYDLYNYTYIYDPQKIKRSTKCKPIAGYSIVLAPIVRWLPIFAHWITDFICPLLFVDEWIWDLNPVVCLDNVGEELFREYMKIIGHENATLVNRREGFVYAETMYVVKGYAPEIPCGVKSLGILREKLVKYYGLENIKPEYYGFMNKDNNNRKILNLKEIINLIESEYNIAFKELRVNQPNRIDFARYMSSIKLLICPGGSMAYNVIFMKENTGFLTFDAECLDGPDIQISCHLKLWHIEIVHPKVPHFNVPLNANITRTLYSFRVINYAVEHQKWPENNLFSPYNFTLFKQYLNNVTINTIPQNLLVIQFTPYLYKIYKDSHINDDI